MNIPQDFVTIVAVILAIITVIVSRAALRGNPGLGNPLIPICVGALTFVGLTSMRGTPSSGAPVSNGHGWLPFVLCGYAALPVAILVTLLFLWARRLFRPQPPPGADISHEDPQDITATHGSRRSIRRPARDDQEDS